MRHFRFYFLLFLTLLLKSCEVPDVQPFTKATTAMGMAIDGSLKRVVADLDSVKLPTASADLDSSRARLKRKSKSFSAVAHAFDSYAKALDAVSVAGKKRGKAIDSAFVATQKIITTSEGFLGVVLPGAGAAAAPIAAAAKPILVALDKLAKDLNDAKTIHRLDKLASAKQDSAIQLSAQILRLGMRKFNVIDSMAYLLLDANLPASYSSVKNWYKFTLQRQDSITPLLAALTQAESYVRKKDYGLLVNHKEHDGVIDKIEQLDYDPHHSVKTAFESGFANLKKHTPNLKERTSLIDALRQRELFYRSLVELPQAQLDAAKARYEPPKRDAELLTKSSQLIDTWASSHHELRLLLAKAGHVTRQEVVGYAQTVQTLADELKAAKK